MYTSAKPTKRSKKVNKNEAKLHGNMIDAATKLHKDKTKQKPNTILASLHASAEWFQMKFLGPIQKLLVLNNLDVIYVLGEQNKGNEIVTQDIFLLITCPLLYRVSHKKRSAFEKNPVP